MWWLEHVVCTVSKVRFVQIQPWMECFTARVNSGGRTHLESYFVIRFVQVHHSWLKKKQNEKTSCKQQFPYEYFLWNIKYRGFFYSI